MSWSFRELEARANFRFPPLHSRRREAWLDNRGTGAHANRDISPHRSRSSTPNTEARSKEPQRLNSDDVPRASVNPFIIQHTDGSQTWLCPCHEESVKWEGNCPSCRVEVS